MSRSTLALRALMLVSIGFLTTPLLPAEEHGAAPAKKTEAAPVKKTEAVPAAEHGAAHAGEKSGGHTGHGPTMPKPKPDEALQMLIAGNSRFLARLAGEKVITPHLDKNRLLLANAGDQKNYAYATILSCSDSRVPVEAIFDAGIMDIFVIRVAGNVANMDELGSSEYGTGHVFTPVLVVLGHTGCGAVTTVTKACLGEKMELESHIPPMVAPIKPAVQRAIENNPALPGLQVVPKAIEENVWQAIETMLRESESVRKQVQAGDVKLIGAIYNLGTGKVDFLPEGNVAKILAKVTGGNTEAAPKKVEEHAEAAETKKSTEALPALKKELPKEAHGKTAAKSESEEEEEEAPAKSLEKRTADLPLPSTPDTEGTSNKRVVWIAVLAASVLGMVGVSIFAYLKISRKV